MTCCTAAGKLARQPLSGELLAEPLVIRAFDVFGQNSHVRMPFGDLRRDPIVNRAPLCPMVQVPR